MAFRKISASGYNIDGGATFKFGAKHGFLDRGLNTLFSSGDAIINNDFGPTGWALSQSLDDYNDYVFESSAFGCALSQVSIFCDTGIAELSVNGHASSAYVFLLKAGEQITVDGFITTIWADNYSASGIATIRAIGSPVVDITKMP
jgi:hypothetical protein